MYSHLLDRVSVPTVCIEEPPTVQPHLHGNPNINALRKCAFDSLSYSLGVLTSVFEKAPTSTIIANLGNLSYSSTTPSKTKCSLITSTRCSPGETVGDFRKVVFNNIDTSFYLKAVELRRIHLLPRVRLSQFMFQN